MSANKYAALRCEFVAEDVLSIRLTISCITTPPLSLSTFGALMLWYQATGTVVQKGTKSNIQEEGHSKCELDVEHCNRGPDCRSTNPSGPLHVGHEPASAMCSIQAIRVSGSSPA